MRICELQRLKSALGVSLKALFFCLPSSTCIRFVNGGFLRILLSLILTLNCNLTLAAPKKKVSLEPKPSWTVVETKLKGAGLSKPFLDFLKKHYQEKTFARTLRLNFLTFRHSPIQKNKVSPLAVKKTAAFIAANKNVLERAEAKYSVSKETIAALLWMETQHGKLRGAFHIPSVFVHILQSDRPEVTDYLVRLARKNKSFATLTEKEIRELMTERSKKKFEFAVEQLKELQEIYKDDNDYLVGLKGSFAGAFGIPQFIPSSFNAWAVAEKKGEEPDLYDAKDAIFSVANYLKSNGWNSKDSESFIRALLKYNNSKDYAATILELARLARDQGIAVYQ